MRTTIALLPPLLARPRLWPAAFRLAAASASRGWWRRPPFLPVPDGDYVAFRQLTHTGATDGRASGDELVAYLEWCREMRRHRRTR